MNSLRPTARAGFRPKAGPLLLTLLALVAALVGACDRTSAGSGGAASGGAGPARDIRDLVTALTPPPADSIPVVKSEFYTTRKTTLERMRGASEAHGIEALRLYREERPKLPEVSAGLLDVAAHTAPEATEELLVKLTVTFGEDLLIRKKAAELLGECMPLRAIDVLEPILRERFDDRTYPPEDRLLQAWVTAYEKLELDAVPLLARIATDMQRPMDVRHLATKTLGRHAAPKSPGGEASRQGVQALESLLVESSGNGYIRRLALQSLVQCEPTEEFCRLARAIQERESDPEFIVFIQSALDKNCR